MADINNINIDTNNYTIDILEQPSYKILLNGQGPQGARGYTGNGIASINLTSSSDNVDTYTITYTDGQTSTFDVTNGLDGQSASIVSVSASVDDTIGTPSVTVTEGGTVIEKTLDFEFSGLRGQPGDAATISVGSVTTGEPGTSATVVNSGTSSAAVFDFTIPKGAKGDTGFSPTATVSKSGKVSTLTVTDLNGTTTTEILDGADGGYTLPIASSNTLGGVKIGNNLTIDANGVLSATASGTVDQTFDGTSANAQSGVAIQSELTNYVPKEYLNTKIDISSSGLTISDAESQTKGSVLIISKAEGASLAYLDATDMSNIIANKISANANGILLQSMNTNGLSAVTLTSVNNNLAINGAEVATQTWVNNQGYITSSSLPTMTYTSATETLVFG